MRVVLEGGGFLAVAQALGLRTRRRPTGFWENTDNLDFELSLFVAAHWMQLAEPETNDPYYYNPVGPQPRVFNCRDLMVTGFGDFVLNFLVSLGLLNF